MISRTPHPEPARDAAPAPATAVLGDPAAPRHAVVLAPVMARWDQGAFFRQAAEPLLATGHRVTIHDTLSLLRAGDDLKALANRWAHHLEQDAAPDVLAGNALGGAIVQTLLDREWTHRAKVLLLSGPTVADEELNAELERIAAAVGAEGLAAALRLLEEAVRGPGAVPRPDSGPEEPWPGDESAGRRLATGLRLLRDAGAREPVRSFPGPLLHVYGEQSLLVRRRHLATGPLPTHRLAGIPGAGMRPHADQPGLTNEAVARFLGAEET
ncbi:alpha/beta fold hydrolase [Streptomyces violens]|uniref:alpha/beta fold hydrolase n=1 Tax=Streptomyces violens TaxID=66377 RepID=UPI00068F9028|nr:hypothetical protein [Streptomyces violens]